jgi:hypothetical protein
LEETSEGRTFQPISSAIKISHGRRQITPFTSRVSHPFLENLYSNYNINSVITAVCIDPDVGNYTHFIKYPGNLLEYLTTNLIPNLAGSIASSHSSSADFKYIKDFNIGRYVSRIQHLNGRGVYYRLDGGNKNKIKKKNTFNNIKKLT